MLSTLRRRCGALPNCHERGHSVLHLESVARVCDTRTTCCMSRAHGTYVALRMVVHANCAYVKHNENKKTGKRLWSRRAQRKGDDPWLLLQPPSLRATSRSEKLPPKCASGFSDGSRMQ